MNTSPRRESDALTAEDGAGQRRVSKCPLRRGLLNVWVLRRSLFDLPSDQAIADGAADALDRWFEPSRYWGARTLAINVLRIARRKPITLPSRVLASAEHVSPQPLVRGDTFSSVLVEFLYWGQAPFMPWPTLDALNEWSERDCVWALETVYAPPELTRGH